MKSNKLRIVIPLALLALAGIGYVAGTGFGTLSAVGWQDISILCPLGALGTMLASKTAIPRALISLALAAAAIALVGRAFCAWACPVPVLGKLRALLKRQDAASSAEVNAEADAVAGDGANASSKAAAPLSSREKRLLKSGCRSACHAQRPENSRHIVLGASLLSAAIFGFPAFCLVCPIGLSFAFVFALIMLFGNGDVSWSVIAIPVLLVLETVLFRKWCSHICPLSALMSLVGKMNRTFRPVIDDEACLETTRETTCGRCANVCEMSIDPRHPERGASWSECTRCRACVEECPGSAISMPLLARLHRSVGDDKPAETEGAPAKTKE